MPRSSFIVTFVVAGLAAAAASPLGAQAPGETVRVRVLPQGGTRAPRSELVGTLERLDADSLVLRTGWRRQALAREVVRHVWVRREARSSRAGALRWGIPAAALGTAIGAAVGAAGTPGESCAMEPGVGGACYGGGKRYVAIGAALGGASFGFAGAALGARYGKYGWRTPDAARGATLQLSPARVAIAIPLR